MTKMKHLKFNIKATNLGQSYQPEIVFHKKIELPVFTFPFVCVKRINIKHEIKRIDIYIYIPVHFDLAF